MTRHATASRRTFLAGLGLAAGSALAIEPITRQGGPRFRLGLAAYSFRQFFQWNRGKEQPAPADPARRLTPESFVDLAADLGCDAAELTSYFFPPGADAEAMRALRRKAFLRGIAISGSAVGNSFTKPQGPGLDAEIESVKGWIDKTAALGAAHLRVFAGALPAGGALDDARRSCIAALEACGEHAGRAGVMLGLENHGGIVATADNLLEVVRAVKSPWVGVNLDTGNFHVADPYAEIARCVPYAVNVQYKGEIQRAEGGPKEPADPARVVKILRDGGYQGYVAVEYEMAADPFTAVPGQLRQLRDLLA
jgi:sugar phosphate isomerase/epimerase